MMTIKIVLRLFSLFLIFFCFTEFSHSDDNICELPKNFTGNCIPAYDYGFSSSTILVKAKDKKWSTFDPVVFSKGSNSDGEANDLVFTVRGGWKPWGNIDTYGKQCPIKNCGNFDVRKNCYPDGKEVDPGYHQSNEPCCLSNGYGLYGLIAKEIPEIGGYEEPNEIDQSGNYVAKKNLPSDLFATFRIAPLESKSFKTNVVKTFTLKNIEIWDPIKEQFIKQNIPRGKIYLKIDDTYYPDNIGGYNVIVSNGGYIKKKGWITKMMEFFQNTFHTVQKNLYENIVKENGFRDIVKLLITMFLIFTIIGFLIGILKINQTELLIRLLKMSFMLMMISDTAFDAIPYFFDGFVQGSIFFSNKIMQYSMFDQETGHPILPITDITNVFSAYDSIIHMIISKSFNIKILALLFTSKLYIAIGIYICIIIMLGGMWRALVQYMMTFFLLALLLIILPIFLISALFKQTIFLWENWIKQFIASCFMLLTVTIALALLLSFILTELQNLLYYPVCWETIWKLELMGITIIDLKWYYPSDWGQFSQVMTAGKFFYVLFAAALFKVYMEYVPELVDSIGQVARRPMQSLYSGMQGSFDQIIMQIQNSTAYRYLDNKILKPTLDTVFAPLKILDAPFNMQQRRNMINGKQLVGLKGKTDIKQEDINKLGIDTGKNIKSEDLAKLLAGTDNKKDIQALMQKLNLEKGSSVSITDAVKEQLQSKSQLSSKELAELILKNGKVTAKNNESKFYNFVKRGTDSTTRLRDKLKAKEDESLSIYDENLEKQKALTEWAKTKEKWSKMLDSWETKFNKTKTNSQVIEKLLAKDKKILDKQLKKTDQEYYKLKKTKDNILKKADTFEKRLEALEQKSDLIKARELDKQEQIENLQKIKDTLTNLNTEKQNELPQERLDEILKEERDLKTQLVKNEKIIEKINSTIEKESADLEKTRFQYNKDLEKHTQSIEKHNADVDNFKNQSSLVKENIDIYNSQADDFENKISVSQIRDNLSEAEQQLGYLADKRKEFMDSQQNLSEELQNIKTRNEEIEDLKNQGNNTTEMEHYLEKDINSYKEKLKNYSEEHKNFMDNLPEKETELNELQKIYDLQKEELNQYDKKIDERWSYKEIEITPTTHQKEETKIDIADQLRKTEQDNEFLSEKITKLESSLKNVEDLQHSRKRQ